MFEAITVAILLGLTLFMLVTLFGVEIVGGAVLSVGAACVTGYIFRRQNKKPRP
jgi:hypothetical protein